MNEQTPTASAQALPASQQLCYDPQLVQAPAPWQALLDGPLRARALEAALFVAERMRDPSVVQAAAERARQQSSYVGHWSPLALCSGGVGVALLYDYLDRCFPGQSWDTSTQQYLSLAAAASQRSTFSLPSLSGGTSGMAFVVSLASRGGQRYQRALTHLHQGLCAQVLAHAWRRPESDGGVADHDYDVISGAAGVLAYLVSLEQPAAIVQEAIEHLLAYLIWLAEPGQPFGKERWYIPPALLPTNSHREASPQGDFNCGLAHGVPGPLAALALTWLAGYRYPGLRASIAYLANWLIEHRVNAPWGLDWPGSVPLECAFDPQLWSNLPPTRSAWCYGVPGVSRSLWLAGQALDDQHLREVALEAIASVLRRPILQRNIPSPNLCHGVGGLLQICLRFAHEDAKAQLREHIPVLVKQIVDMFDAALPLGFCDLEMGVSVDQPAWLTGASGTAMALLAASTSTMPTWDRALVIA